ncbi:MAG: site-2 protease family protein [Deltaproteobacteria bacterium]|nr:site-2 protease family protein [Deltaproteobacteria bacterium]
MNPAEARPRPLLHLVLFVLTLASVYASTRPGNPLAVFIHPSALDSFVFTIAVMAILLAHELGHYFAGLAHRVALTLPFFIPAPFAFGTMGAIIRSKRIARRAHLLDMGVGGPLAGAALAVPFAVIGIAMSHVEALPADGFAILLGDSLLFRAIVFWTHGQIPPGSDIYLHPLALAAWFGLLVTALNLMPAGQLDGGHIVKALTGRAHAAVSRLVFLGLCYWGAFGDALLVDPRLGISGAIYAAACTYAAFAKTPPPHARKILLALFLAHMTVVSWIEVEAVSAPWLVWTLMLYVFRLDHPDVEDPAAPLNSARIAAGWLSLALFVVTFVPVPIRMLSGS